MIWCAAFPRRACLVRILSFLTFSMPQRKMGKAYFSHSASQIFVFIVFIIFIIVISFELALIFVFTLIDLSCFFTFSFHAKIE